MEQQPPMGNLENTASPTAFPMETESLPDQGMNENRSALQEENLNHPENTTESDLNAQDPPSAHPQASTQEALFFELSTASSFSSFSIYLICLAGCGLGILWVVFYRRK